MHRLLALALFLACTLGSTTPARATALPYADLWLVLSNYDPLTGGTGLIAPLASPSDLPAFEVELAAIGDGTAPVLNWAKPVAGSGVDFTPIDFYEFWGGTFYTSIGKGEMYCDASCVWPDPFPIGMIFHGVGFEITLVNNSVPEPHSLALLCAGLLGAGWVRRRR